MGERLTDQDCFICGVGRMPHQLGEENGHISHAFSLDAKVERTTLRGAKAEKPRPAVILTLVPAPDADLRRLLIEKGIILANELSHGGPSLTAKDLGLES